MNNFEDFIGEVEGCVSHYTGNEIVNELLKIQEYIYSRKIENLTPDEASRAAGTISVLLVNLGLLVANCAVRASSCKVYQEQQEAFSYKELRQSGKTIDDCKNEIKIKHIEDSKRELMAKYEFDLFRNLRDSMESLVTVLQTRMRTMEREMKSN